MVKVEYITEADIKESMKKGINGAKEAFEFGVSNPRRNPIEAAIAAINAGIWERNFRTGIDLWVKNLGKVTLEQWKSAAAKSSAIYADRAREIGAKNWEEYYTKAKTTIETAASELVKSPQSKEDFIKFYTAMSKLSEI